MASEHRTNIIVAPRGYEGDFFPITFCGYEGDFLACSRINLWKDYNNRFGSGIIATVNHGDVGLLLKRDGDGCQVQVGDEAGWLTYYFIKELKDEWQTKQLNKQ